ncbi:hypothetical protein ACIP93_33590 [Streptomyces sp. NPDC088745]|uniref:hypothetical protein n=1 Tax=Streptomyces sp. NPDC088745 TaxID=3365884 RepID=UPI0037F1AF35
MITATAVERPIYPECRRSWMQDHEAPTCPAWITRRSIYRAECAELEADNALRAMTSDRAALRYWHARPEERNAQHATLTSQRDAAWSEQRVLLAQGAVCTCIGPDMPR